MRRAQTERQLMKQLVKRQCSFIGYLMRKRGIQYLVMTGKTEEKEIEKNRDRHLSDGWVNP